jgi:aminoglycoside/choline kinase family phosphotransferase
MEDFSESQLTDATRQRLVGWDEADVQLDLIQKGGSDRHYYRVTADGKFRGPRTCILMVYTDRRPDNKSFFAATEVLKLQGVRTPRIYFHDPVQRLAWLEDLGTVDLWEFRNHPAETKLPLYQDALKQVSKIHAMKLEQVPTGLRSHLQPGFDETLYIWEQDYFFNNFAKNFSALKPDAINRIRHQKEFHEMASGLAGMPKFLIHRDFQSQNVIVRGQETVLIDYQGLRPGRPEYDVASLLYDPYVNLSEDERDDLFAYYLEVRPADDQWDTNQEIFASLACQRLMQALGAYGFLGLERGKKAFLAHIPQAVANLRQILTNYPVLPGLLDVLDLRTEIIEEEVAAVA